MNIKLQRKIKQGRSWFQSQDIKKSGKNKFHHFDYYELKDILPYHDSICNQLKIDGNINQSQANNGIILYEVVDLEQDDEQEPVVFSIPVPMLSNGNPTQEMQVRGGIQKYALRYLLQQLWNINESDSIDNSKINLTTPVDKIETDVTDDRANEIAKQIGKKIYDNGGDNSDKNQLRLELDKLLTGKKITNDEYIKVKQIIDGL